MAENGSGEGGMVAPPAGGIVTEQVQFEALVHNLMSGENKLRVEAEETYDSVPAVTKIPLLVTTMTGSAPAEVRSMAAVLLRSNSGLMCLMYFTIGVLVF